MFNALSKSVVVDINGPGNIRSFLAWAETYVVIRGCERASGMGGGFMRANKSPFGIWIGDPRWVVRNKSWNEGLKLLMWSFWRS